MKQAIKKQQFSQTVDILKNKLKDGILGCDQLDDITELYDAGIKGIQKPLLYQSLKDKIDEVAIILNIDYECAEDKINTMSLTDAELLYILTELLE